MTEWRTTTTAELLERGVVEIGDGYRAKNAEFVEGGGLPFVRVSDIGSRIRLEGLDELPSEKAARYGLKISQPLDSLITMKGTVGRVAYVSPTCRRFVYSPQISYWRTYDHTQVDPRWLRYWLESPEFLDQALATKGATDMADYINLRDQRRMRITLPPTHLQRRIATVLGALDDLIENNRGRIELLEQTAQAIYREWFVRFRYPGHEDATFVDSPLGLIPEGWRRMRLDQVADVNGRSRRPEPGEPLRYLDISCLGDRSIGPPPTMDGSDAPGRARRVVRSGDIVWSMVRPNRRAHALLVEPGLDWVASTGLAVLTPGQISSSLLFETVSSPQFSDYLVAQEGGSAYPAVKPKDFKEATLLMPKPELDQRFDEAVGPHHRAVWVLREQSVGLAGIRDLLLPKLVTGEIDVSHLNLDAVVGSVE